MVLRRRGPVVLARDGKKRRLAWHLSKGAMCRSVFTWLCMRGYTRLFRENGKEKKSGLSWRGVLHRGRLVNWEGGNSSRETKRLGVLFLLLHFVIMHFMFGRHAFRLFFTIHGEEGGKPPSHHPLLFMTFLDVFFFYFCFLGVKVGTLSRVKDKEF
ncbi:hypothetical protein LX36DRAFT_197220 [Colletotrichum falcatum]|nr:hypothetical protein LX36DRAFT_197220 [Colletotrichum falcatum]